MPTMAWGPPFCLGISGNEEPVLGLASTNNRATRTSHGSIFSAPLPSQPFPGTQDCSLNPLFPTVPQGAISLSYSATHSEGWRLP